MYTSHFVYTLLIFFRHHVNNNGHIKCHKNEIPLKQPDRDRFYGIDMKIAYGMRTLKRLI